MLTPGTAKNQNCSMKRCWNLTLRDTFWITLRGKGDGVLQFETKDVFFNNYVLGLPLSSLTHEGPLAQTMSLEFAIHKFQPGDWILIQSWMEANFSPSGTDPSKFC